MIRKALIHLLAWAAIVSSTYAITSTNAQHQLYYHRSHQ